MKNLWNKLPAKLRNHIISALVTFLTTFGLIFTTSISESDNITLSFMKSTIIAASLAGVRAIAREAAHALELTKKS